MSIIGIMDLFAGPGGLGEGFASIERDGEHPFRIMMSVEKEESAHATLRLRAFIREFERRHGKLPKEYVRFHAGKIAQPDWATIDADCWSHACEEAQCLELGTADAAEALDEAISTLAPQYDRTILIGGPPCQAYSLVGRSRAKGIQDYRPEDDHRHFLFREYIRVLRELRPAAFIMENVKGVLSSKVEGKHIFNEILADLASVGGSDVNSYRLMALQLKDGHLRLATMSDPADFIVRAEEHGVPQKRHRVIIVGIREDFAERASLVSIPLETTGQVTVDEAIGSLPALRSGLSKAKDSPEAWHSAVKDSAEQLARLHRASGDAELASSFRQIGQRVAAEAPDKRQSRLLWKTYGKSNHPLLRWLERRELRALAQHETRGHMAADLTRYLFASVVGRVRNRCAKKDDYPDALAPDHRSWERGIFSDRFRVQLGTEPSTTIVSHISKDGHYFIHPDPMQCRSLTVREAARLQTFPDDYLFLGNRTQQYVQVGNAVPPYLARQIANLLLRVLDDASDEEVFSSVSGSVELVADSI